MFIELKNFSTESKPHSLCSEKKNTTTKPISDMNVKKKKSSKIAV